MKVFFYGMGEAPIDNPGKDTFRLISEDKEIKWVKNNQTLTMKPNKKNKLDLSFDWVKGTFINYIGDLLRPHGSVHEFVIYAAKKLPKRFHNKGCLLVLPDEMGCRVALFYNPHLSNVDSEFVLWPLLKDNFMDTKTGQIAIFEDDNAATEAGFDMKLSQEEYKMLLPMTKRERLAWVAKKKAAKEKRKAQKKARKITRNRK